MIDINTKFDCPYCEMKSTGKIIGMITSWKIECKCTHCRKKFITIIESQKPAYIHKEEQSLDHDWFD